MSTIGTATQHPAPRTFVARAADFARGATTPSAYLEESIAAYEAWEPHIEAFVHVDLDAARAAAAAATERWRNGTPRSAIDGMPVGIKDIIETANMPTEMGSPLFAGWTAKRDAASVVALRDAGAVILGKTVTTEFAATHPGPTRNPWDTTRTPGGSSSGSAAAVGAGIVSAALGTQVIGSILRPASYCGCVGFKPTVGAINRGGSFDYLSQSAQGVIGASLADAWAVAAAIVARAGGDPGHPGLIGPPELPPAVAPRRIALLETAGWAVASAEAKDQLFALVARLRALGIAVDDRRTSRTIDDAETAIATALPISRTINTWEGRWPLNTLSRDWNHDGLSAHMQARLAEAEQMTPDDYRPALAQRARTRETFAALAASYDAALSLAAPGAAPVGIARTGDPVFAVPGSLLGVPALSLPLLRCEGLPLGAQLLGFAQRDADLVAVAAWIVDHV